jgi:hypothetical protein
LCGGGEVVDNYTSLVLTTRPLQNMGDTRITLLLLSVLVTFLGQYLTVSGGRLYDIKGAVCE